MMDQALNKSDFSIIVKNEGVEDSTEYWQEQCQVLYNSIAGNLPEGLIKPLESMSAQGERVDLVTFFSTIVASEITRRVFTDIIIPKIKEWVEYRPTAEIELVCPDGSTVKISNLPLPKLARYFEENPKASICEGLNHFKNY